jgi:hypothetical protein
MSPTVYLREALPDARARIEGGDVERSVEQIPTQGGQYTEVVTTVV